MTVVSVLIVYLILWLMTRTVIEPCHSSCLLAPCCPMLCRSRKRSKVFIQKLSSQRWMRTDLFARTSSTTRMTEVRTHPAAQHWVASCLPHLALQTRIHSWGIPGIHYPRATNRRCMKIIFLLSSVRSSGRRTRRLLWSSQWKQHMLMMLFFFPIWPPTWRLRSLRWESLTQASR